MTGLDEIGREVDKLTKYVSKDEEYAEHIKEIQEILDVLGMHGALLTFEVEEVLTPERFEEIGRLCRELDLEKVVQKANEVLTGGYAVHAFPEASNRTIEKIAERMNTTPDPADLSKVYPKRMLAISIALAFLEVLPQIMRDVHDDNDRIEDKTIEEVMEAAFKVAFSALASKGVAELGLAIGFAVGGPVGGGIGFVIGSIIGSELGAKIGTYTGQMLSVKAIESRN